MCVMWEKPPLKTNSKSAGCAQGQGLGEGNATRNALAESRDYWLQENRVNIWNTHSVLGYGDIVYLAAV